MSDETWSVVKTTFATMNVSVAAPILSECCGIPLSEASVKVRTTRGIIVRLLERERAESAARRLTDAGFPTTAAQDSFTARPPRPLIIRQASATAEAFIAPRGLTGGSITIPWSGIAAIGAGRVTETVSTQVSQPRDRRWQVLSTAIGLTTGIPTLSGASAGMSSRSIGKQQIRDYLDLLAGDPLMHFRMDGGMFNYATLIPQPAPVAEANFCFLLSGLLRVSPGAASNVLPNHVAPDGSVSLEIFTDEHDFDHLVTWLLAIQRLGLWSDALRGTGEPPRIIP